MRSPPPLGGPCGGSGGRRFKSCRPDQRNCRSEAIFAKQRKRPHSFFGICCRMMSHHRPRQAGCRTGWLRRPTWWKPCASAQGERARFERPGVRSALAAEQAHDVLAWQVIGGLRGISSCRSVRQRTSGAAPGLGRPLNGRHTESWDRWRLSRRIRNSGALLLPGMQAGRPPGLTEGAARPGSDLRILASTTGTAGDRWRPQNGL